MKKILSIALALMLVLALAACGEGKTNNDTVNNSASTDVSPENYDTSEWEQFLKDYDAWVDDYIEIVQKYKDNPSDTSTASDYQEMMTKLTEWTTKTEEIQKELEEASPTELAEYSDELSKILAKLDQVSQ